MTMVPELVTDEATAPSPRLWRVVGSGALTLLLLAAAFYLWPTALGGCATFTIVTGQSMEPTYSTGDVVFSRCGVPEVGDVAVYASADTGGARIIHRVIGGDASGWELQGDNNSWVDPFTPTQDDMVGIAKLHIPKLGLAADVLANTWMWLSLLVVATALLMWPTRDEDEGEETDEDELVEAPAVPDVVPAPAVRHVDDFRMDDLDEFIAAWDAEQLVQTPSADETEPLERPLFDLDADLDWLLASQPVIRTVADDDDWWTDEIERLVFPNGHDG